MSTDEKFPRWFCTKCRCTWSTTMRSLPRKCARDHCGAVGTVVPYAGQATRDLAYIHQRNQITRAATKKAEGRTRRERKEVRAKKNK